MPCGPRTIPKPLAFINYRTEKKIMTKIRLKGKLTKKDYLKVTIFVVTFLIAKTIFSDWRNFKAGLFGKTPISIHKNN